MTNLPTFMTDRTQVLPDGCHQWTGVITEKGYGRVRVNGDRHWFKAHRVAYELVIGPIPDGLVIDHLCRNRACVNVEHLEPVTNSENVRRGWDIRTGSGDRSTCPSGHEMTADNVRFERNGKCRCKQCRNAAARIYRAAKSAVSA